MSRRILNSNGLAFDSFDDAARIRDFLSNENPDKRYKIELFVPEDSSKGFMIVTENNHSQSVRHNSSHKTSTGFQDDDENFIVDIQTKTYHPACITYLLYLPLIVAGLLVMLFSADIWMTIFGVLGIKQLPGWVNGHSLVSGLQFSGALWVVWLVTGILTNYFGTALIIDQNGVTLKKGIIARDEINVRFNEIRTIGLKQGILDRLLNIGMLEFASSGTDDVDIRFFNIANPKKIKNMIEDIIREKR